MKITRHQLKRIIKEEIDSLTEMDDDEQLIAIIELFNGFGKPMMNAIEKAAEAAPKDPEIKERVMEFLKNLVSKAESIIPDPETNNIEVDL